MHRTTAAVLLLPLMLAGAATAYWYFGSGPTDYGTGSSTQSQASTGRTESPSSLVIHDVPRSLPALSFVDGEVREQSLADFRGKTILLNIWATWCVPCRKEMPALDRLQAKLGGSAFEVVPLSIDRDGLSKVKAFYKELGLKALGIHVDPSAQAGYRLGAVGIPTTLLINPEGQEIGRLVGPTEWDSPELVMTIQTQLQIAAGAAG